MSGGFVIILVLGFCIWVWRSFYRTPPSDSPSSTPPSASEIRIEIIDDRDEMSADRIKQLLAELESPAGYWTFANVPVQLEHELERLLASNPRHEVGLRLKARLPFIKRESATRLVLMRVQDLSDRAEVAVTVATKQKSAKEGMLVIDAALAEGVAYPDRLKEKREVLRRYVAAVEISGYIEKAKRFEFKGNTKKAIEYYQDALYSAMNDDVADDEQKETIDWLVSKLTALGAPPPSEPIT